MVQEKQAEQQEEMIVEIELSRLRDFKDHPFKVKADNNVFDFDSVIHSAINMIYSRIVDTVCRQYTNV